MDRVMPIWRQIEVDDTAAPQECARCGFDSVLTWRVYLLAEAGVARMARGWLCCTRCADTDGHPTWR